jgi:uncharacterized protein (TIRG00374 family)
MPRMLAHARREGHRPRAGSTFPAPGRFTRVAERDHAAIDPERLGEEPLPEPQRRSLRRTAAWLTVTGVSLYLVAPSLFDVLGSARDVTRLDPVWLPVMAVAQVASLACLWALQHIALHRPPWGPVITSQLAGNALAKIAPGGGAIGAALQYRMLVDAGVRRSEAVTGVTAANVLVFGVLFALPILAVPAIVRGTVTRSLVETAVVGLVVFVALAVVSAAALARDGPLRLTGRVVERVRNRLRPHADPLTGVPERLLAQRDRILAAFGPRWKRALGATVGRWAFDYATLLAALAAVGSDPRPVLVLLAFSAAQVLALVPVTPGGLGFVEAGLTATLALAGVGAGNAVLATFSYRLFNYWLTLPAGLVAWLVHRRRVAVAA